MKPLQALINHEESALPLVQSWVAEARTSCEILPPSERSGDVLHRLQVTTRSPMGAVAHGTGGLLIDGGWLRVLGSGHPRLTRDIASWNSGRSNGFLLIADDAVGGFFAINGGGLGADAGALYYRAPDTLEWEPLELSYTDFLRWALGGGLEEFYEGLRWPGWQTDAQALAGDQGFSFYPFLWTREGSPSTSSRKAVDVAELYAMNVEQAGA